MKKSLNPKWLLLSTVFPMLLLFAILLEAYTLIDTELNQESLKAWKMFAIVLGTISILNFACIAFFIHRKRISIFYPLLFFPIYLIFCFYYFEHGEDLFPWDIPRWMLIENIEFYALSLLTPTIFILLLSFAISVTNMEKKSNPYVNLFFAALIPLLSYLGIQVFDQFDQYVGEKLGYFLFCLTFTLFLFFVIRFIIIISNRENRFFKRYAIIFKAILGIVFPILGLLINQGVLFGGRFSLDSGIFGNFSNAWFYILAVLNGVLFCIGNVEDKRTKLFLFALRCITFTYIVYFFIVFLPFLPLSVIFILAFGLGFITLTPLLLFFFQGKDLLNDYRTLKINFSQRRLQLVAICGFLVIPLLVVIQYKFDRYRLDKLLDYVYSPDYADAETGFSRKFASRQVSKIKRFKNLDSNFAEDGIFNYTPYLSNVYKRIVYDNLMLSDAKIGQLEHIFEGETEYNLNNKKASLPKEEDIVVDSINVETKYDPKEHVYLSTVHLVLRSLEDRTVEFQTELDIPDGVYIADYYLKVGDKVKKGILAEKRTATWIYNQIVNENEDPGILSYKDRNKLELKVFPFWDKERRYTGFTLIHKDRVEMSIGERKVIINANASNPVIEKEGCSLFFSESAVGKLDTIQRKPFYYFIIDASKNNLAERIEIIKKIQAFMSANKIDDDFEMAFQNWKYENIATHDWVNAVKTYKFEGGCNIDYSIGKTLFMHMQRGDFSPKIVVISDDNIRSLKSFAFCQELLPDEDNFYQLIDKRLLAISLKTTQKDTLTSLIVPLKTCRVYKRNNLASVYLPTAIKSYIYSDLLQLQTFHPEEVDMKWKAGIQLAEIAKREQIYPKESLENWLEGIQLSFKSNVLSSNTMFMVLENEMQEEFLRRKQKEVLKASKNMDVGEEIEGMTEPGILYLLVFMSLVLLLNYRRIKFVR